MTQARESIPEQSSGLLGPNLSSKSLLFDNSNYLQPYDKPVTVFRKLLLVANFVISTKNSTTSVFKRKSKVSKKILTLHLPQAEAERPPRARGYLVGRGAARERTTCHSLSRFFGLI